MDEMNTAVQWLVDINYLCEVLKPGSQLVWLRTSVIFFSHPSKHYQSTYGGPEMLPIHQMHSTSNSMLNKLCTSESTTKIKLTKWNVIYLELQKEHRRIKNIYLTITIFWKDLPKIMCNMKFVLVAFFIVSNLCTTICDAVFSVLWWCARIAWFLLMT